MQGVRVYHKKVALIRTKGARNYRFSCVLSCISIMREYDMDFFDHPINKKILLGELPLKQLYPHSSKKVSFFDYKKLSIDEVSLLDNNPELFNFLLLNCKQIVEKIEKLNITKEFFEKIMDSGISTLVNAKCPPEYLKINSTYMDSNNLIPVVTSLDKALLYGIYMYSIENQLDPNSSTNNFIKMMYAWIYLLLKAQESEIITAKTIDLDQISLSTNLIHLLLNAFNGDEAKRCLRPLSRYEHNKLKQLETERHSLMMKIQGEWKIGWEIANKTENEWKLFLDIIHDLAKNEFQTVSKIHRSSSPKEKIKKIREYDVKLLRIEKGKYVYNRENIDMIKLLESIHERVVNAQAFTQVRCINTTPFRLNPLVFSLLITPKNTVNYLYISFHKFRLDQNEKNALEFASLALNCIKRNLDGKEKENNSLDDIICDFYYMVNQFIKNYKKSIDRLSFEKLQGNISVVLNETANPIFFDDMYNKYLSEKMEEAKNSFAYRKALDNIENGIIPTIDSIQQTSFSSVLEAKKEVNERKEKALAQKIVLSQNIIYMFCDAIRIMVTNNRIKLRRIDDAKKCRLKLLKIDDYLVHKVYAHLGEREIGMLEYREKYGIDTKNLTEQEKQEEEFRNSTVAEGLKDTINELVFGLENKSAEKIIEIKTNIREEIRSYPECDNKNHFAIWLDNISSQICTALVNDCKKQTDDFRFFKEILLSSLGDTSKMLPTSAVDSLATAEMLYNKYANDDFALKGFDFSCISALYYQAFEDSYNALIWKGYAEFLNNLIVDEKSYTDILLEYRYSEIANDSARGYLFDKDYNQRNQYIKYAKTKNKTLAIVRDSCMYKSFGILMKEINRKSKSLKFCDYFSKLTGYPCPQEMFDDTEFITKCEYFSNMICKSAKNRNNASHGGASISVSQCKEDKNVVISDLEEVRSNSIGLIQKLLYLLQNSKQTIVLTDDN